MLPATANVPTPGGVMLVWTVLADGSVHALSELIDHDLFQYLGDKNDREAVFWP